VETHVIGESLDLYGKRIEVAFLKRLRDEKRFETKDLLFAQIRADAAEAKKVCEERKKVFTIRNRCAKLSKVKP
jgi:riboflavin kinase/FMN adenylyltransferase